MSHKLLLIDTNILSHAITPNQTEAYKDLFKDLETTYIFVVTGLTKYEILCSSNTENRDKISKFIEENMSYATLSEQLMDFSSKVCYLYSKHPSTKGRVISIGDIVNASFSIAKDCDLLTIDNNDYPMPFFTEVSRKRITYNSKKNKSVTDAAYILRPDLENIIESANRYGA